MVHQGALLAVDKLPLNLYFGMAFFTGDNIIVLPDLDHRIAARAAREAYALRQLSFHLKDLRLSVTEILFIKQ